MLFFGIQIVIFIKKCTIKVKRFLRRGRDLIKFAAENNN